MSTITIADKFARTDEFASRLESAFFADEVWAVFAELEQPATAAEIADRLQQPPDAVLHAINLLITHQLVRRQLKSWRDFLAQKGTGGAAADAAQPPTVPVAAARAAGRPGANLAGWPQPSTPTEVPAEPSTAVSVGPEVASVPQNPAPLGGPDATSGPTEAAPAPVLFTDFKLPTKPLHETHRPEPAPSPAPAVVPEPSPTNVPAPAAVAAPARPAAPTTPATETGTIMPVSFTVANDKARFERKATAAMTISFRVEAARSATTRTSWKLRPLLQAIEQKGGGGLPGQLLVYRVFIHVPAEMMHAAGIQSISLVDDTVVIRDRAFHDALCQAAHAVASIDLRSIPA